MSKLCFIFNTPSLYRKLIYTRMDMEFNCDWYFGDWNANVKGFDTACLKNPVNTLHVNNPGGSRYSTEGLSKLLRDNRYEKYLMIGDAHDTSTWWMLIMKCFFNRKKKIYFWTHGWYGKESKAEKFVKRLFYQMADGVFLYGYYAENLMIKMGFDQKKLYVIHNSLDYDSQIELRNQIKPSDIFKNYFGNDNKTIIVIGRLNARKRIDQLLEAVRELKDKKKIFNVVLVGDGDERTKLEELTTKYDIKEQVWFYGACYDEITNAELIYNADVCVMPGDIGLTAIHCLTFGTPCITHDSLPHQGPEFEAIQESKTGSFFRFGDVESLVATIVRWFDNHVDRESIRSECYREIDTRWTPDFQLNVLHSVLDK